jgi:hypothetical protein
MSSDTLPDILDNYVHKDEHGDLFFDFERIVPIGDVPDWYEQRREKWGTKWPGYEVFVEEDRIQFFTARSPPIPVIEALARLHHDIEFRLEYYEPGNNFRGEAMAWWDDGDVVLDDQHWEMTKTDLDELGLSDEEVEG